ncbi:hypothetical protein Q1695_010851 [Nippostrongylus brasiliensis]|nr:hypothetical protein Q1695_010851 [Nippostrongylus brasiliensis]
MSESVNRADKLAIAKKKLKEFEARRHREYDSSPVPSVASTAEHVANNGRLSVNSNYSHCAGNNDHSTFSPALVENGASEQIYQQQPYVMADDSMTNSSPSLSVSNNPLKHVMVDPNASINNSPLPTNANGASSHIPSSYNGLSQPLTATFAQQSQLQHERDAAVAAYEQVSAQLEQLRGHYTQLHAAYSSLSGSAVQSDSDRQIQQLQSALAVLVEEKTSVQSELRSVKSDLEQERILNESLAANLKSLRGEDSKKLQSRVLECEHLLSARSLELDGLRRSEANAQAQLLAVQHERSEAQARLKVIAREKDVLDAELKQTRKDLHMKEIYLKQLGPQGIVNNVSDESAIKALHDRIDALQSQVTLLTAERDQMHHNSEELSRHYEICRLEFVNSRDKIASELAETTSERDAASLRVKELENDVSVLQKELFLLRSNDRAPAQEAGPPANTVAFTDEHIAQKVKEARLRADAEWQEKFEAEGRVVDDMMRSKDQLIFEREQTISELQMRLRLLEERSAETRATGSDLLSLSEQLQNEKATVSRAVAQNRELKEQLIETEDRLVALTEEKLQSELARQTAEHQVKELMKQIDSDLSRSEQASTHHSPGSNETFEAVMHPPVSFEPSRSNDYYEESERDRCESAADTSREREHILETQLEMANQQLEEVRADLRRSHTRNEEMNQILRQNAEDENQNSIHVELGQAVTRIHELAAENQQLRENIEQLVRERSELRPVHEDNREAIKRETNEESVNDVNASPSQNLSKQHLINGANVGSDEWARGELEKRFAQAMYSNAELRETLDSLEHINLQLQLENDTIADHVILYQHQRRLIRERLRAKDEQLAAMEADRQRTLERCKELQKALMEVLGRTGALKEYEILDRSNISSSKRPRRRVARSYSHSTVDEFSGDEDVIVNGSDLEVPPRTSVDSADENASIEEGQNAVAADTSERSGQLAMQKTQRSMTPTSIPETDAAVRKILQIITDISRPPNPTSVDKLHCTQCIGEIQTL